MITGGLFTPRVSMNSHERLHMLLNKTDAAKIKRGWCWREIVTDQRTGKVYMVQGASCGIQSCFCDAIIVMEMQP